MVFRRIHVTRRKARESVAPVAGNLIGGNSRLYQERLKGTDAEAARLVYTIGIASLTRQGVVGIYRRVAERTIDLGLVDLPPAQIDAAIAGISSHSLRVGLTQDLFAAGEDGTGIAQALRWSSPTTALRYGRKLAVKSNVAARVRGQVRG